jgi:serine/threonine protein phosphatase 1
MFRALRRTKPEPPSVPAGMVVFAIGDVHGRDDLLGPLLDAILDDLERVGATGAKGLVVGLGDYVDRGSGSRQVVDRLIELQRRAKPEIRLLCGNHDEALLQFLDDPIGGARWLDYGGRECLQSYRVDLPVEPDEAALSVAGDALAVAMPPAHLQFFEGLESSLSLGDYFFTHAGARPGVALEDQDQRDLRWIREPFLSDVERFDRVVVHGHSVTPQVHADYRRIGIDTGAYASGRLTALRLEGSARRLLFTEHDQARGTVVRQARL